MSDHRRIERQIKAMHFVIAQRLRAGDLSALALARENLSRWQQRRGSPSAACAEWEQILDQGIEAVLAVLEGDTEDAIRIRSSSPFAGALTARERWEILASAA